MGLSCNHVGLHFLSARVQPGQTSPEWLLLQRQELALPEMLGLRRRSYCIRRPPEVRRRHEDLRHLRLQEEGCTHRLGQVNAEHPAAKKIRRELRPFKKKCPQEQHLQGWIDRIRTTLAEAERLWLI